METSVIISYLKADYNLNISDEHIVDLEMKDSLLKGQVINIPIRFFQSHVNHITSKID